MSLRNLNQNGGSGYDDGPDFGGAGRTQVQFALPPLTPITKKLLILNVAIFLATFFITVGSPGTGRVLFNFFGLTPTVWDAWFPILPLWQLVTYGFLHSTTGFFHILMNMVQLYFFGTMLEGILGSRRFLTLYLAAAVFGALLHLGIEFLTGALSPAIGASGAVLGVVVATATLRPHTRIFIFFIPITVVLLAGVIVAIDVLSVVRDLAAGTSDGVAHWIHLGGALCGFTMVRLGWINIDWVARLHARRAIAHEERRARETHDMDQLLEKIQREGMNSLTKREKDFLKRVSKRK